jgi:hypothetical protein
MLTLLAAAVAAGAGLCLPPLQLAEAAADRAPTPEELRALVKRTIANQHHNDTALNEFERRERRRVRENPDESSVTEDKTFRVVPTGTGTLKLVVEERGQPIHPDFYQKQLRDLEQVLVTAAERPNDPRQKRAVEKWQKRTQERWDLVQAVEEAFRITFLGRAPVAAGHGRLLMKLQLDPNPAFKPRSRIAGIFQNVRAVVWVDESTAQLVRAEADIFRDISFGGGLFGKVYRGGRFVMEQAEVAPGIWLPTLYRLDFEGRKFFFGFDVHETTVIRDFRRIGPPREALGSVRRELANSRPRS